MIVTVTIIGIGLVFQLMLISLNLSKISKELEKMNVNN